MLTTLKKNDYVYFLYSQHLIPGIVVRVNRKTITVKSPGNAAQKEIVMKVKQDRIAHYCDEFVVVWDTTAGPNGKYYITDSEFRGQNQPGCHWNQPYMYVTKQ